MMPKMTFLPFTIGQGHKIRCEYVDVEITWNLRCLRALDGKESSEIISSFHDWSGQMKWDGDLVKEKYALALSLGVL